MDRKDIIGSAQIAGGGYLAYKGVEHGLPRAFGIRTEYHITSKENAKSIKKCGNRLLPKYGGKNGWSNKIKSTHCMENSKGYVHITGIHNDAKDKIPFFKKVPPYIRAIYRNAQKTMYRNVGNIDFEDISKKLSEKNLTKKEKLSILFDNLKNSLFKNKTKTFCIPGIDSYFNKNFIPDTDDFALKSTKSVKVYNNRFSALIAGLKKFGLKGAKENKSRVVAGISILSLGIITGINFIKKGINNIKHKNEKRPQ